MRIAVLTLTSLAHDSRVLRTASTLVRGGHEVTILGMPPAPTVAPCPIMPLPPFPSPWRLRLGLLARHAPAQIWPGSSHVLFWLDAARRAALAQLRGLRPDLIIANDWVALPIADRIMREFRTPFIYDSHEFATMEFADRRLWRLLASRHVATLEGRHIRNAAAVVAVSPSIASALNDLYGLGSAPVVIRNVPDFAPIPFRATPETMSVLFHGLFRPERGLEALIDSVNFWRPGLSLRLRGYGAPSYVASLRARAAPLGDRIQFVQPVAPENVVQAASTSEIGIFALPDSSPQSRFALPNKLFEYIAAGLALAITPLPDMKALVDTWRCGTFIGTTASSIAAALNALTWDEIDQCRRASSHAAQHLTWPAESTKLVALVEYVLSMPFRKG